MNRIIIVPFDVRCQRELCGGQRRTAVGWQGKTGGERTCERAGKAKIVCESRNYGATTRVNTLFAPVAAGPPKVTRFEHGIPFPRVIDPLFVAARNGGAVEDLI